MKRVMLAVMAVAVLAGTVAVRADDNAKDEAEIKAIHQRFAAAFKAKNVESIMTAYVPDESLVVFDVVPPRQYVGAKAYRKDFEDLFAGFASIDSFEITDLTVETDGKLAYARSIQHATATDKDGKKMDITIRVTDVFRKINGQWLIIHEHSSVPVDLTTGKADLTSKP